MEKITELNSKWWYRLMKVIFWMVFIVCFLIFSGVVWTENAPYTYTKVDNSKSYVQCNKDKLENLVYFFDKNLLSADYTAYDDLSDYSKDRAKELCSKTSPDQALQVSREETRLIENGIWNYSERSALIEKYKAKLLGDTDYTFYISKEIVTRGGYFEILKYEVLLLLITLILMYLVSSVFMYVTCGQRFKNPFKRFSR